MKKIRFGLLQYPLTTNPLGNRVRVFELLEKMAQLRPHYIVLPEMWLGGPKKKGEQEAWSRFYRESLEKLVAWCCKKRIGCFFSQLEKQGKSFFNTAYFIEKASGVCGKYRKINLFKLDGESEIFCAGKKAYPFETPFGKIGCVVCYDIRFPELTRSLACNGAKMLIVCAQWPEARAEHWITLLKARAIENQFFVIATNRLGTKGKNSYKGHSMVIDPWGKVLLHLPATKQMGIAEIDLNEVKRIRQQYPFFKEAL